MDVQRTTAILPAFGYIYFISCLFPTTSTFSRKSVKHDEGHH